MSFCCESFKWKDTDTQIDSNTFHNTICHTKLSARIATPVRRFIFSVVSIRSQRFSGHCQEAFEMQICKHDPIILAIFVLSVWF
jgi:hypothetical protein